MVLLIRPGGNIQFANARFFFTAIPRGGFDDVERGGIGAAFKVVELVKIRVGRLK